MTVPVPLTDIEAAHHQPEFGDWDTDDRFCHGCPERWPCPTTALCEALRIAVEGLDRVERWYVCKNVPEDDGDFITCRGFTDDSTGWCGWCSALDAIEQVNRLVDLRPVVEGDGSGHVLPPFDPNVERMDEL